MHKMRVDMSELPQHVTPNRKGDLMKLLLARAHFGVGNLVCRTWARLTDHCFKIYRTKLKMDIEVRFAYPYV